MRFAICNEVFDRWQFAGICAEARAAGYQGLEIAPYTLGERADVIVPQQRSELRMTAADAGLEIVGLHWVLAKTEGFHISCADPVVRRRTSDYLRHLVDLCADLGGSILVFGSPKQRNLTDGMSTDQAWAYAVDTFRSIVPNLEERGVTLCLEPLAPVETDFITTAAEGMRLVAEVDSPSFQLLLDVKAMSTESKPIPQIISESRSVLKHFHANDANLRGPGFGQTDFVPIAAALKDAGYNGWVSVEVFDFSPDPLTIANKSIEYLTSVFAPERNPR